MGIKIHELLILKNLDNNVLTKTSKVLGNYLELYGKVLYGNLYKLKIQYSTICIKN
jgi:FAD synthase